MFANETYDVLCTRCDRLLPFSAFHRHRNGRPQPRCKDCRTADHLASTGRPSAAALSRQVTGAVHA